MLLSPRVIRCDLWFIEQVCNLHSRVDAVCLSGLSQPALILFQLLQVTLEIEKSIATFWSCPYNFASFDTGFGWLVSAGCN